MPATLTLAINPRLQFQLRSGVLWHCDAGTALGWVPTEFLFAGEENYDLKVIQEIERFFELTVLGVEKVRRGYISDFTLIHERAKNGRRPKQRRPDT
jgi:hypothetical protein